MNNNNNNNKCNNNVCNNCGKQGHMFHQCKLPITSYGIIAFRTTHPDTTTEFLMIRRKNSFGYIDFIRGKYSPHNLPQLKTIVDEMSLPEKQLILTQPFELLWSDMWGETMGNNQFKNEELTSRKKFELLKDGVVFDNVVMTLEDIVRLSDTQWKETEWEFPKGRRNPKERDLDCALREFSEETGIPQCKITVVENILPFEELFIGSNHKAYKHKYFIAHFRNEEGDDNILSHFQTSEVSKLEWKTLDQCLECIRSYSLEKKEIIQNINKVLQEYRLFS